MMKHWRLFAFLSVLTLLWAPSPQAQSPGSTINFAFGPNKLRGTNMLSWFHGNGMTGATAWCSEGIINVWTGNLGNNHKVANDLDSTYNYSINACEIVGQTSVTNVTSRFVIESNDAVSFANTTITCQWPVKNATGGSVTPTLTVYSGGSQDNWSSPNTDVNAVSLSAVADGATALLTYTWTGSATSNNGLSIDINLGNNFSTTGKKWRYGGGFNCRTTPGFPTGTGATSYAQAPDMLPPALDDIWNRRFYLTTYDNGSGAGSNTHSGIQCGGFYDYTNTQFQGPSFSFGVVMRAVPTLTFYDGAGNASKVSSLSGTTWTDNAAATVTPVVVATGFQFPITVGGGTGTHLCLHYAADATLTGN